MIDEDSEDDEMLDLKERLAAYNLDSSPDQSAAGAITFNYTLWTKLFT